MASAPMLWVAVLIARRPFSFAILEAHGALYTACLTITLAIESPGHSSPGEAFGNAIFGFLFVVLGIEALVGAIVFSTMKEPQPEDPKPPKFIFLGLTVSLLGGWFVGVLAWSMALPAHVIAAAEAAALDRPYCIEAVGKPAHSADDLTGLKMRPRNYGGFAFSFHAVMVIGAPADRSYMNWSFRSGRFEPVSQHARLGLRLDAETRCSPMPHFARDWPSALLP